MEAWTRHGGKFQQAIANRLGGLIALQSKNYDEASRLLNNSLVLFRELGDSYWTSTLLNNLGRLASVSGHYDAAEEYYLKALELAQNIHSKERQEHSFRNLGVLALNRQQWHEARKWFEQVLVLARELRRVEAIAQAQYGLASVCEAEGRTDLALSLAQEALDLHQRLQHRSLARTRELVERLRGKVGSK
jgi:tetratricopeptide (TPR) repeat protein